MKVPEQRRQRDGELAEQQAALETALVALQPAATRRKLQALVEEAGRLEAAVSQLSTAAAAPLAARLQELAVRQVAHLRRIMSDEIRELEQGLSLIHISEPTRPY